MSASLPMANVAVVDDAIIRAERECLGLAIRDEKCREAVLAEVCPGDFYRPSHLIICQALLDLAAEEKAIDEASVINFLSSHPAHPGHERSTATLLDIVTGVMYVHNLVWETGIPSVRTAAEHARVVADAARRRHVFEITHRAAQLSANPAIEPSRIEETLREALERLRYRNSAAWPEPLPLSPRLLPFPVDALPGGIRRIVDAVAESTQTPPDLAAFTALATLSAAARGSWEVRVRANWDEQIVLYLAALSPSGDRKSAVVKAVGSALRELEWSVRAEEADRTAAAAARYAVLERRARAAVEKAAKAGPLEYPDAMREAERLAVDLEATPLPAPFRLTCDDTTPEELANLMAAHGGAMAVLTTEGGLWETFAGRYAKTGAPNVDLALKAYGGEQFQSDRVTRTGINIKRPVLTLGFVVQPDVMAKASLVSAFTERGFIPRMLFALPASMVGTRALEAPEVPAEIADEWRARVAKVFYAGRDATVGGEPGIILLDADASAIFDEWRGPHEKRLHPDLGDLAEIRTWGSKLPGALVRVAALFTLAERPGDAHPQIGAAEMAAAITLADYFIDHAREVLVGSSRQRHMAAVLVWVRKAHRSASASAQRREGQPAQVPPGAPGTGARAAWSFTLRELHRGVDSQTWAERVTPVEAALADLEDLGYVRRMPTPPPTGRGRAPSARFEANPRFLAASAAPLGR